MTDTSSRTEGSLVLPETAYANAKLNEPKLNHTPPKPISDDCIASMDVLHGSRSGRVQRADRVDVHESERSTNEDPEEPTSMLTVPAQCAVQILPERLKPNIIPFLSVIFLYVCWLGQDSGQCVLFQRHDDVTSIQHSLITSSTDFDLNPDLIYVIKSRKSSNPVQQYNNILNRRIV